MCLGSCAVSDKLGPGEGRGFVEASASASTGSIVILTQAVLHDATLSCLEPKGRSAASTFDHLPLWRLERHKLS